MVEPLAFWAREQLKLRETFEKWVGWEINRYEAEGFDTLFGQADGHGQIAGTQPHCGVRPINPADTTGLQLTASAPASDPAPADLPEVTVAPGDVADVALS